MNGIKSTLLTYLLVCFLSTLTVVLFAYIQYGVILKDPFQVVNYLIPVAVGIIFGFLLSRNMILRGKLKGERDIILEKNKRIRSFTGTIVHDLKNPVSAIHGLVGIILEKKENLDEDTLNYLHLIQQSSNDILENITLVLDKTRLEAGIKPDHLEVGNPYFTIQSVIDKHILAALEKSISIERLVDKDLPDVKYDKNALDHIISNLISNAIKFSPPSTQVKIYNELLSDRLKIVVQDEGLGMTPEDIENAFTEFKVLSARPTGNETSTGLGLSIVKQLVDQIGGDIAVKSEGKNKGSTFELTLNLASPQK
jgi:signal transduction histidine kinase